MVNRTIARCADGSDAIHSVVTGMGHSWPAPTDHAAAIDAGVVHVGLLRGPPAAVTSNC
jgi:hypothetical protein